MAWWFSIVFGKHLPEGMVAVHMSVPHLFGNLHWLMVYLPPWKIWVRQLGKWIPKWMEKSKMSQTTIWTMIVIQCSLTIWKYHIKSCHMKMAQSKLLIYPLKMVVFHRVPLSNDHPITLTKSPDSSKASETIPTSELLLRKCYFNPLVPSGNFLHSYGKSLENHQF